MASKYTDEDRAIALTLLATNGGNIKRTSEELGIPRKTIDNWSRGKGINLLVIINRQEKAKDLASKFEDLIRVFLQAMEIKMKDTSNVKLLDLVNCLSILIDKWIALDRFNAS